MPNDETVLLLSYSTMVNISTSVTVLTFSHCNIGGHLFEETVCRLFADRFDRVLRIKNDVLLHGELLDKVNATSAIIVAGGPIIGNEGAYPGCWMGFLKLNPQLNAIKVPIILFGVGVISIPFRDKNSTLAPLTPANVAFLRRVALILTRDKLTKAYLESQGIECDFMGCPSLAHNQTSKLAAGKGVGKLLFSPSILIEPVEIQVYQLLSQRYKIVVCINHNDAQLQMRAANLFQGAEIKNLVGTDDMLKVAQEVSIHVGYRVHQHIACLLAGTRSILIESDNRGKGMNEVIGNKYGVRELRELKSVVQAGEKDDYEEAYANIDGIRTRIQEAMVHIMQTYS